MIFLQKHKLLAALAVALLFATCSPKIFNPAAEGFNAAASDKKAVAIADEVMQAMGGRQAWDATRFISWTFFGSRTLTWDKHRGICRVDWQKRPWKVIVNLHDGTGKVQLNGVEQTHPDTLKKYLDFGKRAWINDSYWLAMPFKLKDSGVTLKYLGEGKTERQEAADILQLTFSGVGVTPDNKYHVWVDKKSRLVTQWAFFKKYADEKPDFTNAWANYKPQGRILLSSNRGKEGEDALTNIVVSDVVAEGIFERF